MVASRLGANGRQARGFVARTRAAVHAFASPGSNGKGKADETVLGFGGTALFGRMLQEDEWNADLKGLDGLRRRERMVRRDPTLHAAYMAVTLPLISVAYHVEPFSDDQRDRDIAEFVEATLFGMRTSWSRFVEEAYDFTVYGNYAFEKLWERRDGRVVLADLAARPPTSIDEYLGLPDGSFGGIRQTVIGDTLAEARQVDIPPEKLLYIVRRPRGNNIRGAGLFDACNKPYTLWRELEVIAAIAAEMRAAGVAVGTLGVTESEPSVTDARRTAMESALMGLHVREKQYFVETPGNTLRLEGLRGAVLDPNPMIERLQRSALSSVLAEFVALGSGAGSFALARDKSSFFLLGLKAHARCFTEAVTDQVIRDIVRFNFPDVPRDEYPWLIHDRLDTRDVTALVGALAAGATSGLVRPDRDVQNLVREVFGLPELEDEAATQASAGGRCTHAAEHRREPTALEKLVDFDGMNRALDAGREAIIEAAEKVQAAQARALVKHAERAFKRGTLDSLLDVDVDQDALADEIEAVLLGLFTAGKRNVEREAKLQGLPDSFAVRPPNPKRAAQVAALLKARAKATARNLTNRMLEGYAAATLTMARTGTFEAALLLDRLLETSTRDISKAAATSVSEALSLGRKAEQLDLQDADLVEHYDYSTLQDANVCGPCLEAERRGQGVEPGDPLFEELYPPLTECEGRDRCRCDFIAKLKGEARPGA